MICASFKFLGKQPTKLSLGLFSLEIDTFFAPAFTSSHSLEGIAGPHSDMELLLLRA